MKFKARYVHILILLGAFLILLINFGKLFWVKYFSESQAGDGKPFYELILDTLPLFILVIVIGLFVGWLRNKWGQKD